VLAVAGAQVTLADAANGPADAQVAIADFYFGPPTLAVSPGTTVVWLNRGPSQHTSTSDDGAWDSGALNPGGTYAVLFNTAGTYTYHCAIHPQMVATIVVGASAGNGQPPLPPPFGYAPSAPMPGYAPYGQGYPPYSPVPGYAPYGPMPGYMPYGPMPGSMPYGGMPSYAPYGRGYAPYGPGMRYSG
jgi:plastocyanin